MDAGVLSSELDELEDKLRRAEEEDEAGRALASVDFAASRCRERPRRRSWSAPAI